jgi:2-iminobutanoate/2-iminopropanoate deaminase
MRSAVWSPRAGVPVGPYSPALRAGQWLFVSGQIPLDPATGRLVEGDTAAQTGQVLENLGALLRKRASTSRTSSARQSSWPTWRTFLR